LSASKAGGKTKQKQNKTQTKIHKLTAKRDPPTTTTNPDGWTDGLTDGRTDGRIEGFVESFYIQQSNNTVSEPASEQATQRKAAGPAGKLGPVKKTSLVKSKTKKRRRKKQENKVNITAQKPFSQILEILQTPPPKEHPKKEEEEEERMKMIKESNYMYVLRIRTTQLYSDVTSSTLKQQRQQEAAPHMGSDIKEERERERGRESNTSPAVGR
jgi:hypothetical protein